MHPRHAAKTRGENLLDLSNLLCLLATPYVQEGTMHPPIGLTTTPCTMTQVWCSSRHVNERDTPLTVLKLAKDCGFGLEGDSECGRPTPEYANALQDAQINSNRCLKLYCAVAVFITWSAAKIVVVSQDGGYFCVFISCMHSLHKSGNARKKVMKRVYSVLLFPRINYIRM